LIKFSLVSTLLLACACSSAGPTQDERGLDPSDSTHSSADESSADESSVPSQPNVLQRFTFEDLDLSFEWMGEGDSPEGLVGIGETFGSVDYLAALRDAYGPVTSLEIFKAFAPEGMTPHSLLVASHEGEALALGRTGAELDVLDIDGRTLSIDKSIPANCQASVLPNISPGTYGFISQRDIGADGQLFFLCVAQFGQPGSGSVATTTSNLGCARQDSNKELTVGICNDSASVNPTEFFVQTSNPLNRTTQTRPSVPSNQIGRFTIRPSSPVFLQIISLGVIGRNSTANTANFHRQVAGLGFFP